MNRRSLLATGAGLVVAAAAVGVGARMDRLDDAADAIGLGPHRLPAAPDEVLLKSAVSELAAVTTAVAAVIEARPQLAKRLAPLTQRGREQTAALGKQPGSRPAADDVTLDDLAALSRKAAGRMADDAMSAVSGPFAQTLASISAGLLQSAADLSASHVAPARPRSDKSGGDAKQSEAAITALQRCLSQEHRAIYAYGFLGGRLKSGTDPQVRAARSFEAHRRRRDALSAIIDKSGATPVAPRVTYRLPRVSQASQADRLGQRIERESAAAYLHAVGATEDRFRALAISWLHRSALDILDWGASPVALPGRRG